MANKVPDSFNLNHFLLSNQGPEDENPYSMNGVSNGSKSVLDAQLRKLRMRTSSLSNSERCKRLLIHYTTPDLAEPRWYSAIPLRFIMRPDFWIYHSSLIRFLNMPTPKIIIVFLMTWLLHYASFQLYASPIKFRDYKLPSCSAFPNQPWCSTLKNIQDYTFGSLGDFGKMGTTIFLHFLYGNIIPHPRN